MGSPSGAGEDRRTFRGSPDAALWVQSLSADGFPRRKWK